MWLTTTENAEARFINLDMHQEVRFLTVRALRALVPAPVNVPAGDDDDLVMTLVGKDAKDVTVVLSFHKDAHQHKAMTIVQSAIRQGLENGTRLLDLDRLVDKARANLKKRD